MSRSAAAAPLPGGADIRAVQTGPTSLEISARVFPLPEGGVALFPGSDFVFSTEAEAENFLRTTLEAVLAGVRDNAERIAVDMKIVISPDVA